jgi:hypothetical protein
MFSLKWRNSSKFKSHIFFKRVGLNYSLFQFDTHPTSITREQKWSAILTFPLLKEIETCVLQPHKDTQIHIKSFRILVDPPVAILMKCWWSRGSFWNCWLCKHHIGVVYVKHVQHWNLMNHRISHFLKRRGKKRKRNVDAFTVLWDVCSPLPLSISVWTWEGFDGLHHMYLLKQRKDKETHCFSTVLHCTFSHLKCGEPWSTITQIMYH